MSVRRLLSRTYATGLAVFATAVTPAFAEDPAPRLTPSTAAPAAAATAASLTPLGDDQVAILRAPGDEPLLVPIDQHYPRTNEWRLDTLFPAIAGLGGGYVGVGADQNYTLAGAARSEFVWLIDHDPVVRDLHLIYGALIPEAENAAAFIAFFERDQRERARELVTAAVADPRLRKQVLRRYDDYAASGAQRGYFKKQARRKSPDGKPATWLGDPAIYDHVRALFKARRVHTVAADLGGPRTMAQIAEAATKLDTTIRVVYVSNAEAFFPITDQVRANYKGLPHDEKSVLVRTVYMGLPRAKGSVWHYQAHDYADFVAKVQRKRQYPSHRTMVDDLRGPDGKKFIDARGFSRITAELPRRPRSKPR